MVLVVSLKFTSSQANELCLYDIRNTLHPLIFTPPSSIKTHFSKELTESHGENQQTDLFVWVVKHRDQRWDAFQTTHIRLDLVSKDKKYNDVQTN